MPEIITVYAEEGRRVQTLKPRHVMRGVPSVLALAALAITFILVSSPIFQHTSIAYAAGDTTLINAESFEGTWPPAGWTETNEWNKESNRAYQGTYCADFNGASYPSPRSGDLTTPSLDCSDASYIYLEFWWRDEGLDNDDFILRFYDGSNWDTIQDMNLLPHSENAWILYSLTVTDSQYFISNFKVRWSGVTVVQYEHIYVDLVTVNKEITADVPPVVTQLGLCFDGSLSINSSEFTIIKAGIAAAVRNASQMPHNGTVELTVVQFGTGITAYARVEVPPTVVTSANFESIATTIEGISQIGGYTPTADGLLMTWLQIKGSPNFAIASRQVINVATNGGTNTALKTTPPAGWPTPPGTAWGDVTYVRDNAAAEGLDEIDAEGIGVSGQSLANIRDLLVYPQPGTIAPPYNPGWVRPVANAAEFAVAVGEKFIAVLQPEYYLTVKTDPTGVTTIPGEGWYPEYYDVILTAPTPVTNATDVQYRFSYWDVDGYTVTGNPITVHMDANHTATAHYVKQYKLTMVTNFGTTSPSVGSYWYDEGSVVTISATPPSVIDGERYVWNGWTGTGTTSYTGMDNPATVTMNSPITQTASWTHQYRLTMATNYGTTSPSVGEHWYEAGTVVPISATAPSVIDGERYVWLNWTGTGTISYTGMGNPSSVTMNGPISETASWAHQFLLTIKTNGLSSAYPTKVYLGGSEVGTASDSSSYTKWFDSGASTGSIGVDNTVSGATDTRYVFIKWIEDSSTINPRASETMNAPKNFTAQYNTQYYLTVNTNPAEVFTLNPSAVSGDGWYDSGSTATVDAVQNVDKVMGQSRYDFRSWTGATPTGIGNKATVLMDGPKTATANYQLQYYLTFDQTGVSPDFAGVVLTIDSTLNYGVGSLPVSFWWDDGVTHTFAFQTPLVVTPNSKQYIWASTAGLSTAQSGSITVTSPGSVTGTYKTQYYVTFAQTGLDSSATGTVATVNGAPVTFGQLPYSMWANSSAIVTYTYGNVSSTTAGKRFILTSVTGPTSPITIIGPTTVTGNYKTQYLLTVRTDPLGLSPQPARNPIGEAGPVDSWWYDASTSVTLTAQAVSGSTFTNWDVNGTSQGNGVNPIIVQMNAHYIATAHYTTIIPQYLLTIKTSGLPSAYPTTVYLGGSPAGTASDSSAYTQLFISGASTGTIGVDGTVLGASGTRYVFVRWIEDSSSNNPRPSETMNSPKTFTAEYKTQYYLTVNSNYGAPSGAGWYDASSTANAGLDTGVFEHTNRTRRVFTNWSGDASGANYAQSNPIVMNGPKTAEANWKTQYLLAVSTDPAGLVPQPTRNIAGDPDSLGRGRWYDASTNVELTAPNVSYLGSALRNFQKWQVDSIDKIGNPIIVVMNQPHEAIASYTAQIPVGGVTTSIDRSVSAGLSGSFGSWIIFAFAFIYAIVTITTLARYKKKKK